MEGDRFLRAVKGVWDDHTGSMRKLKDILKYMVGVVYRGRELTCRTRRTRRNNDCRRSTMLGCSSSSHTSSAPRHIPSTPISSAHCLLKFSSSATASPSSGRLWPTVSTSCDGCSTQNASGDDRFTQPTSSPSSCAEVENFTDTRQSRNWSWATHPHTCGTSNGDWQRRTTARRTTCRRTRASHCRRCLSTTSLLPTCKQLCACREQV